MNHPHDQPRVRDAFVVFAGPLVLDAHERVALFLHDPRIAVLKPVLHHNGARRAQHGLDVEPLETLGLCLGANEERHPEDNTAQTQDDRFLAMSNEPEGDVQRRRHGETFPHILTVTARTRWPGLNKS